MEGLDTSHILWDKSKANANIEHNPKIQMHGPKARVRALRRPSRTSGLSSREKYGALSLTLNVSAKRGGARARGARLCGPASPLPKLRKRSCLCPPLSLCHYVLIRSPDFSKVGRKTYVFRCIVLNGEQSNELPLIPKEYSRHNFNHNRPSSILQPWLVYTKTRKVQ